MGMGIDWRKGLLVQVKGRVKQVGSVVKNMQHLYKGGGV